MHLPGKIRHGGHVATVGTPDVVQDLLLEVRGDSVPEDVGCRGEWWRHTMETFGNEVLCDPSTSYTILQVASVNRDDSQGQAQYYRGRQSLLGGETDDGYPGDSSAVRN